MNGSMRDTGGAGGSAHDMDVTADYRIREVEARLDRRVQILEAQRSRAQLMAGLSGASLILTVAVLAFVLRTTMSGDADRTVDSLSAEQIVLRDADGVERGRLATGSDGRAQLSLSDQDGRERIRLTVLADGSPGVTISDSDDRPRAVLGYLADGTTNLVLADAQGVSRAVFGLDPDGSTQALFSDRDGAIRTLVGVGADGIPAVSVFEERGSPPSP